MHFKKGSILLWSEVKTSRSCDSVRYYYKQGGETAWKGEEDTWKFILSAATESIYRFYFHSFIA